MPKAVLAVLLISLLPVAACAKSPKCSDSGAKTLALNLSKNLLYKNEIYNQSLIEPHSVFSFPANEPFPSDPFNRGILTQIVAHNTPELDVLKKSKDLITKEFVANLESKYKNSKLESIRTSTKDDNIDKCSCEADIVVDGSFRRSIKYTVQKTDDRKLYVEIIWHNINQ